MNDQDTPAEGKETVEVNLLKVTKSELRSANTKVATCHIAEAADEGVDILVKDAVRTGAVIGLAFLAYTNPIATGIGLVATKLVTSRAARKAKERAPLLEEKAEQLKHELAQLKLKQEPIPDPDEVVPAVAGPND